LPFFGPFTFFPDVTQWFASAFYSLQCKRGATSPLQQAANENKKIKNKKWKRGVQCEQ